MLKYSGTFVGQAAVGMKLTVDTEDTLYEGEVVMAPSELPPDADPELKKFAAIDVKNKPVDVEIGDIAKLIVTLDQNEDALILPLYVIQFKGNERFVHVLKDGLKTEKDIKLGIRNNVEAEILEGLEEGEKVIR